MFTLALMTATGMFIVLWKIGAFKLFKYKETRKVADGGLDATMTFSLIAIFAGTFSGMIMAMTSGLILSGMLFIARSLIKPTKSIRGTKHGRTTNWFGKVPAFLRRASNH